MPRAGRHEASEFRVMVRNASCLSALGLLREVLVLVVECRDSGRVLIAERSTTLNPALLPLALLTPLRAALV